MQIPITPQEIVNAVVGNNPAAVKAKLQEAGLTDSYFQLTASGFTELLGKLPITSRNEAIDMVSRLLDVQIDNNGFAATWLYKQITDYGMNLGQITHRIFDASLPAETGMTNVLPSKPKSTCGCSKKKAQMQMTGQMPTELTSGKTLALGGLVLGLAVFGLLCLIAFSVRLILKTIS
jgi:hypothetical protein